MNVANLEIVRMNQIPMNIVSYGRQSEVMNRTTLLSIFMILGGFLDLTMMLTTPCVSQHF